MNFFTKITELLTPKRYGYYPENLHRQALPFLAHLNAGDLKSALSLFQQVTPEGRPYLVEALSDLVTEDDFYDKWFDNSNGPEEICLLRGALLLVRAWHYRGWGRGEDVDQAAGEKMHETLKAAESSLLPLLELPDYGQNAAARLIRISMGLEEPIEQTQIYLKRLREFERPHMFGEHNYMVAVCKKWSGSHQEMFEFARATIKHYDQHPHMGGLIALAHFERQLFFDNFDEDKIGGEAYRADKTVLNEVLVQSERLLALKQTAALENVFAHNATAAFFADRDDFERAEPHFKAMRKRVTRFPWSFYYPSFLHEAYNVSML
jgi:hypothetical protein